MSTLTTLNVQYVNSPAASSKPVVWIIIWRTSRSMRPRGASSKPGFPEQERHLAASRNGCAHSDDIWQNSVLCGSTSVPAALLRKTLCACPDTPRILLQESDSAHLVLSFGLKEVGSLGNACALSVYTETYTYTYAPKYTNT